MRSIYADCTYAIKLYRQTLRASLIAILVLAVATASVCALLSLYVALTRPHPGFEQSGRIATIGQIGAGVSYYGIPYMIVERMADEMSSVMAAAFVTNTSTLVGAEREQAATAAVSDEFFGGLRPRLAMGRGLTTEDHAPAAEPVVVLSYRYWQEKFDSDRNILGTIFEIATDPGQSYALAGRGQRRPLEDETFQFRIVGVMAETSTDLAYVEPAIWVPLERIWPTFIGVPERLPSAAGLTYVRMQDGISATAVQREFRARFLSDDAQFNLVTGWSLDVIEGIVHNFPVHRDAKRQLELLLAASVLLAIVAAANVSLFLLARAPGRHRELGIRVAVGAPLRRLMRQLATEAGLLVVVSGALGLAFSVWLSLYLGNLPFLREAEWNDVTLFDWRVLSMIFVFLLILVVLVSLAPILGLIRLGISASSRQVAAGVTLAQKVAGTIQIVIACTFGSMAIAFAWHLASIMFGDAGFDVSDRYSIREAGYVEGLGRSTHIELARRREVIEAIPGVTRVAFGDPVPGEDRFPVRLGRLVDVSGNEIDVYGGSLSREFIDILGFKLIHGRVPDDDEPAVVVNQSLARAFWGRDDVIGEILFQGEEGGPVVVGVLEDVSFYHPAEPVLPYAFENIFTTLYLDAVVETSLTAAELKAALDRLVSDGSLEIPRTNLEVRSLKAMRAEWIAADIARGVLTMSSAALVVTLAVFGLYGMLNYLVANGRREYAIHMSLGAGPKTIRRAVVRKGSLLALPGLVAGVPLAFITVNWVGDDLLSKDIPFSVVTIGAIVGLSALVFATSLATARKAARTQPAPYLNGD